MTGVETIRYLASRQYSNTVGLCRYIKWSQEQCAAQGGKAELQQVLETATKSLSTTTRYNNDVRLLRIWVQYVSKLLASSCLLLSVGSKL